jgi:hypothetical protein
MRWSVLALCLFATLSVAAPRTVCTITVNSEDERNTFRRHLPETRYRFVELVQRGRPDWLEASCRAKVQCDVLVISAHFDGGSTFFSDRVDASEHLTVAELERVSCNGKCPSLFAKLKEVYLFGCNTLNPSPQGNAYSEVVRGLLREGRTPAEAEREMRSLTATGGEASRDRMRQIFAGVPVIYGFSSTAPLGAVAGPVLDRYLRASGDREIARGRPSRRLLADFSGFGMSAAPGVTDRDQLAAARSDMCYFADDRLHVSTKLSFVHHLLQRDVAEARMYLDRIESLRASLDPAIRENPAVTQVLENIALDVDARERVLDYARRTDRPEVRVRMLNLARDADWLTEEDRQAELAQMLDKMTRQRDVGVDDVNLACSLNRDRKFDDVLNSQSGSVQSGDTAWHAALRACLGSAADRGRVLQALHGESDDAIKAAQAYVRLRPLSDGDELARLAAGIVAMPSGGMQARALETLGQHYLSDANVLDQLVDLYAGTVSPRVQAAIAGVLLRADRRKLSSLRLLQVIETNRLAEARDGIIDVLLAVLRPS